MVVKKLRMETTSNLSGLLNITTFMKYYGPLRLYWEGGYKGEGLLGCVKPLVTQGTHKLNFAKNIMTMYYKNIFLQIILDLDFSAKEIENDDGEETDFRYNKFRTYMDAGIIEDAI